MATQSGTVLSPALGDAVYDNHVRLGYIVADSYVLGRTAMLAEDESVIEVTQNTARTISKRIYNSADGQPLTLAASDATAAVIQLKKIGGNFATITPTLNRRGTYLDLDLTSGNLDTVGDADVTITIPGAIPASVKLSVIKLDKNDNVRAGLTALPSAEPLNAGGLLTYGTGTGQINTAGGRADADVKYFGGTVAPAPTVAGIPKVEDATARTGVADLQARTPSALTGFGFMKSEIVAINGSTVTYPFDTNASKIAGSATAATDLSSHATSDTGPWSGGDAQVQPVIAPHLIYDGDESPQSSVFITLVDASLGTRVTGLTGSDVTMTVCKTGGTYAAATGSITELANGDYRYDWGSGETDTLGALLLHVEPNDSVVRPVTFGFQVINWNVNDPPVTADPAEISDAVWDEVRVDHVTSGTFGEGTNVTSMSSNVITAAALATDAATEIATAVWDFVLEGTDKAKELARGWTSALINLASGFNTSTRKYRDRANTKDRITATVDATGRTAVTTDLT